jgi:hypothetical protein
VRLPVVIQENITFLHLHILIIRTKKVIRIVKFAFLLKQVPNFQHRLDIVQNARLTYAYSSVSIKLTGTQFLECFLNRKYRRDSFHFHPHIQNLIIIPEVVLE